MEDKELIQKIKNIPDKIFLVIGEENDISDLKDFKSLDYEYVLWSEDRINSTDIEYTRTNLKNPLVLPSDDELLEIYDKHSSIIAHWDGALVTMSLQQFIDAVKSLSLSQPQKEESLTTADHLNATLLEKVGIIADKNVKIKELEAEVKELNDKMDKANEEGKKLEDEIRFLRED